jgi:hypothetical protein
MTRVAIVAQGLDLLSFIALLALVGPQGEANPVVRAALAAGLGAAVVGAKIAVLIVLATWARATARFVRPVAGAGMIVGFIGWGSNLGAIAHSLGVSL